MCTFVMHWNNKTKKYKITVFDIILIHRLIEKGVCVTACVGVKEMMAKELWKQQEVFSTCFDSWGDGGGGNKRC